MFIDESLYSSNNTLTLRCHLWNEDTSVYPSAVCSGLTEFGMEAHSCSCSWKCDSEGLSFVWKKKLLPKSKIMPAVEICLKEVETPRRYSCPSLYVSYRLIDAKYSKNYTMYMIITIFSSENKEIYSLNLSEYVIVSRKGPSKNEQEIPKEKLTDGNIYKLQFDMTLSSNEMWLQMENNYVHDIEHYMKCVQQKNEFTNQESVSKASIKIEVSKPAENGTDSLIEDLSLLLSEKRFCDVTLIVEGKEFSAHKIILCVRSSVFNTMFESDMKEKETGVVNIDDIDSDVFEIFLNYLYRGKIDNLTKKNATSLYSMANKYQILSLRNECSAFIFNNLSKENVCSVLLLSDMHQDEELKNASQDFFCTHCKSILLSKEWVTLLREQADLAAETLEKMALKM